MNTTTLINTIKIHDAKVASYVCDYIEKLEYIQHTKVFVDISGRKLYNYIHCDLNHKIFSNQDEIKQSDFEKIKIQMGKVYKVSEDIKFFEITEKNLNKKYPFILFKSVMYIVKPSTYKVMITRFEGKVVLENDIDLKELLNNFNNIK